MMITIKSKGIKSVRRMDDLPPGSWFRDANGSICFKDNSDRIIYFSETSGLWADGVLTFQQRDEVVREVDVTIVLNVSDK